MKKELVKGNYASREELVKQIVDMTNAGLRGSDISNLAGVSAGVVHYLQKTNGVWERVNKPRTSKAANAPEFLLENNPVEMEATIKLPCEEPLQERAPRSYQYAKKGLTLVLDSNTAQMLYDSVVDVTERLGFQPTLTQAIRYMLRRQRDIH